MFCDIIYPWRQLSALPGGLIPAGSYMGHHAFGMVALSFAVWSISFTDAVTYGEPLLLISWPANSVPDHLLPSKCLHQTFICESLARNKHPVSNPTITIPSTNGAQLNLLYSLNRFPFFSSTKYRIALTWTIELPQKHSKIIRSLTLLIKVFKYAEITK